MILLIPALFKLNVLFPLFSNWLRTGFGRESSYEQSHIILGSVKDKRHFDQLIDQRLSRRKLLNETSLLGLLIRYVIRIHSCVIINRQTSIAATYRLQRSSIFKFTLCTSSKTDSKIFKVLTSGSSSSIGDADPEVDGFFRAKFLIVPLLFNAHSSVWFNGNPGILVSNLESLSLRLLFQLEDNASLRFAVRLSELYLLCWSHRTGNPAL